MADVGVDVAALLAPAPGANPAGEDLSFAPEYDAIKEARRADDPTLPQGEWQRELKSADWLKARALSAEALARSKDLQLGAWLAEALARLSGFAGVTAGLEVMKGLLEGFWDGLYPPPEDGDFDLRAARIAWLNTNLAAAVREIPLTSGAERLGWRHWKESRDLDNLAKRDPMAAAEAAEGKVTVEAWDKAVAATPAALQRELVDLTRAAAEAASAFEKAVDARLGRDAPSLSELRGAVEDAVRLAAKIAQDRGLIAAVPEGQEADAMSSDAEAGAAGGPAGPIRSREEALRRLAEIADFFRRTEPHSPVAHLVSRAASWGRMPLEAWLAEVIKDANVLDSLRETLGIKSGEGG